jgi:hypothetical protein
MNGAVAQGIVYEVLLQRDRKVRRAPRLLRDDEVNEYVSAFNRCTDRTGITAVAKAIHVPLTCLNGDFDGEW